MKKIGLLFQKWGHYLLALLCAGVILLSALWTRQQQLLEIADAQVLADDSQRLSDAASPPPSLAPALPTKNGRVLRLYSEVPLYFPAYGLWRVHPGVDYEAAAGEMIFAIRSGSVQIEDDGLYLLHEDGRRTCSRGLAKLTVAPGQRVKAGEQVGPAGAEVYLEGRGHVCIICYQDGLPEQLLPAQP